MFEQDNPTTSDSAARQFFGKRMREVAIQLEDLSQQLRLAAAEMDAEMLTQHALRPDRAEDGEVG